MEGQRQPGNKLSLNASLGRAETHSRSTREHLPRQEPLGSRSRGQAGAGGSARSRRCPCGVCFLKRKQCPDILSRCLPAAAREAARPAGLLGSEDRRPFPRRPRALKGSGTAPSRESGAQKNVHSGHEGCLKSPLPGWRFFMETTEKRSVGQKPVSVELEVTLHSQG